MKKYIFASDHGGYDLKEELIEWAKSQNAEVIDLGPTNSKDPVSYAEYGFKLANEILKTPDAIGIGVCGTGLGISYALNRVKGIRAARVTSTEDGQLAKMHNNANALAFGGRQQTKEQAIEIINAFNKSKFEGGRHLTRIKMLDD